MKKRKFLSVFAILFVAIFALSVCFFAACKSNKDEEEETTPETEVEDENDDDINDGTDSGTVRSGSPLTGDEDDIIGTWSGEVEIRAELSGTGYGGTLPAEMNVEITAENFVLAFTPSDINYDSIVYILDGLDEYVTQMLADNGIAVGEKFVMFENFPVLVDEEGYFADIDGDWVKCQIPVEVNEDGQLLISFAETMAFENYDIDIKFDAVLDYVDTSIYPREDYKVDIANAEDSEAYLAIDENTVFVNDANLDIYTEDGIEYAVSGTASLMTENMAKWFNGGSVEGIASEGDPYVIIKVAVAEGETISYTSEKGTINKSYTNSGDGASDFDDNYLFIVYKLTISAGYSTDGAEFTVTSGEETVTYTVSLTGVMLPATVTITTYPSTLKVGGDTGNVQTSASWSDGSSYKGSYTWTSSDESIATVAPGILTGRANVTPVSGGTAVITVTLDSGDSASFTVTVEPAPQSTSFTVTSDEVAVLEPGDTMGLTATVVLANEDSDYSLKYTWTSSDESVATVASTSSRTPQNATVTAVGEGTATITVTLNNGESKTYDVTVNPLTVTVDEAENTILGDTTFANNNSLNVTKTIDSDGNVDYSIAGAATIMSSEQLEAYNSAYSDDTATEGDAFIVIKILAPAGSSVKYGEESVDVETNGTYALFIQKISADDTTGEKTVTISSGDETSTFTVTYSGVAIPDNKLVGTWSNSSITATATIPILGDYTATASAVLTVKDDGTYTLVISDINVGFDLGDLVTIEMVGTWYGGNGTYTLTGEGGNSVTVTLGEDEQSVSISFSMTFSGIGITVSDETLTSGSL